MIFIAVATTQSLLGRWSDPTALTGLIGSITAFLVALTAWRNSRQAKQEARSAATTANTANTTATATAVAQGVAQELTSKSIDRIANTNRQLQQNVVDISKAMPPVPTEIKPPTKDDDATPRIQT